ncbi:MAG: hypothetical protein ACRDPV_10110, partial [Gaiellaceae bacterium]
MHRVHAENRSFRLAGIEHDGLVEPGGKDRREADYAACPTVLFLERSTCCARMHACDDPFRVGLALIRMLQLPVVRGLV